MFPFHNVFQSNEDRVSCFDLLSCGRSSKASNWELTLSLYRECHLLLLSADGVQAEVGAIFKSLLLVALGLALVAWLSLLRQWAWILQRMLDQISISTLWTNHKPSGLDLQKRRNLILLQRFAWGPKETKLVHHTLSL
jgi:hypothetical protein